MSVERVFGQGAIDFNQGNASFGCIASKSFGKHMITPEQVVQGSSRIPGLPSYGPQRPSAFKRRQSELPRWNQPNALVRPAQQRLHKLWQQSKTLNDYPLSSGEFQQILQYQTEALASKPVKCLKHGFRTAIHPPLIYVHLLECGEARAIFWIAPPDVIQHRIVRRIKLHAIASREPTRDRGLSGAASPADPIDVLQATVEQFSVDRHSTISICGAW
jgi:hypothetical protein